MAVSRRSARGLTELEGAVLGALALHGPCTPYRVRRVFLESPSPYWSGSAGAIYPLMARLERRLLVRSRRSVSAGGRAGRRCGLTASGRRAFRAWLLPPWPGVVTGVPADPLRTRVSFLGVLRQTERSRFFEEALAATEPAIRDHVRDRRAGRHAAEPWESVVAEGALAALRARRAWLAAARGRARSIVR
jgi:DNA-binding PadR family transcriptional regulator